MFGGKILLTNATKTNEHSNVTIFVHGLMHMLIGTASGIIINSIQILISHFDGITHFKHSSHL